MDTVLSVLSSVFWGLLMLSVLVFLHEGGHFLAARACGVRVTEFFLGLPCRFDIHYTSRRIGTKFGVTPLLLGGYAAICGMDPTDVSCADRVLAAIYRHGRVTVADLAVELELSEEDVLEACALLLGWGSIAPWYEEGEKPSPSYYPTKYQTLPRDAAGYTTFDGRRFDREHATAEGDVWELPCGEADFLAQERSHTYLGQGFLKRAFMLLAGILVNILTGFLLLMSIYSIAGVTVPIDTNVIGQVDEGSIAAKAGIEAGDAILSVDGVSCSTWMNVYDAIGKAAGKDDIAIEYERDGKQHSTTVALKEDERLGVYASTQVVRLDPITSARLSFSYVVQTAEGVMRLLQPQHTMEILDQSSSIVGISVMSCCRSCHIPFVCRPHFVLAWLYEPAAHPTTRWRQAGHRDHSKDCGPRATSQGPDDCELCGHRALCAAVCLYASFRHPSIYSVGECLDCLYPILCLAS